MPNFDDSKWRVCCCCHVTRGALILAWISVVLSIFSLAAMFAPDKQTASIRYGSILTSIALSLLTCLPIIIGEMRGKRKPGMYLPYLILNGIALVLLTLASAIIFVVILVAMMIASGGNAGVAGVSAIVLLIVAAITFLFLCGPGWWFFSIVYRAYKYSKEEEVGQYGGGGGGGVSGQKYVSKA